MAATHHRHLLGLLGSTTSARQAVEAHLNRLRVCNMQQLVTFVKTGDVLDLLKVLYRTWARVFKRVVTDPELARLWSPGYATFHR